MIWWGALQARIGQLRHRPNVEAAWHQPSGSPRQSLPAVTVIAALFSGRTAPHRPPGPPQPVQLRRQRPGAVLQVLQVAMAVERPPVDAARPAAPVAGLRTARTGVVGLGPARAAAALPEPGSGRDGDLPGPARLPAAHEASPPWPGCQAPTNPPSRRARPSRNRMARPPYAPAVGPAGAWSGCDERPKAQRPARPRPHSCSPDVRPAPGQALRMRVGGFHHARRPASRCRVPLKTLAAMLGCALQPLCHGALGRWLGSLNNKAAGQEAMSSQDEVGTVGRIPTATCSMREARSRRLIAVAAGQSLCGAPRRNRTGDPIPTMNRAPTAVRSSVSAGRWQPSTAT
jgi:hypothetical protein